MSELTPEERRRIYEEEKVRMEAQASLGAKQSSGNLSCCGGCAVLGVVGFVILLALGMSGSPSSSSSSSSSEASSTYSSSSSPSTSAAVQTSDAASVEYKLATIYEGHSPSGTIVQEFANVLDSLEVKCLPSTGTITTREGIGNVIVKVQEEMDKEGVHESLLELAHHLNDSIPSDAHHLIAISEIGAAYAVLRTKRN
jgi:hypothetical protein